MRSEIGLVQKAVASRQVTAVAVVEHALGRIAEIDPELNAVVGLRADPALREARELDRGLGAGDPAGPLAGVPFLVKDLEDVRGLPTTQGSVLLRDSPPAGADSTVVARLRAAGAIVVGKANLPEFATEGFTANELFGVTRNPWSLDHSPGGSSGGSAAAMSAGMVPLATATDGGGSIRIPAAFCGLVGLKPTNGLVGRWPAPDWIDYSTEGPFATCAADLGLLMDVECGPVGGDPTSPPGWARGTSTRLDRVFAVERFGPHGPLPAGVRVSLDHGVAQFESMTGLTVEWTSPESLFGGADPDADWFTVCTAEHVARLGRRWVEEGLDLMHPAARGFMEWGLSVGIDDYLSARRRRFEYVRAMDELLGDAGVLVSPTVASAGWLADGRPSPEQPPAMQPPELFNTALQNITGHPSMSLPCGTSDNGVPFGLQVTAPRYADQLLLDLAAAWEAQHPWPQVAPGRQRFSAGLGLL
ncbi:MAG: amidase [Actinomycetota bacterium]|nr:amidase [Actinomycetota bacterium]